MSQPVNMQFPPLHNEFDSLYSAVSPASAAALVCDEATNLYSYFTSHSAAEIRQRLAAPSSGAGTVQSASSRINLKPSSLLSAPTDSASTSSSSRHKPTKQPTPEDALKLARTLIHSTHDPQAEWNRTEKFVAVFCVPGKIHIYNASEDSIEGDSQTKSSEASFMHLNSMTSSTSSLTSDFKPTAPPPDKIAVVMTQGRRVLGQCIFPSAMPTQQVLSFIANFSRPSSKTPHPPSGNVDLTSSLSAYDSEGKRFAFFPSHVSLPPDRPYQPSLPPPPTASAFGHWIFPKHQQQTYAPPSLSSSTSSKSSKLKPGAVQPNLMKFKDSWHTIPGDEMEDAGEWANTR